MNQPLHGYIGLGSNLGNRLSHLQRAVAQLMATKGSKVLAASSVYECAPQGYESPNMYLNAVIEISWDGPPLQLQERCYKIEASEGRHRQQEDPPRLFLDRTIDLDVLWLDGVETLDERLTLPHPRAHLRAFVLVPWLDLDPAIHIGGLSLEDHLSRLPREEVSGIKRCPAN